MTYMPNYALPLCISLLVLGGLCSCPVTALSPDAPFIMIVPVGDHAVGQVITISGTTSYPVNTTLWISLGPKIFTNYPPNYFDGQSLVTPGVGSNLWQVTINTSTFVIDEYSVRVEPVNSTPLFSSATFNMTGKNVGIQETPATPVIVIDPPGNHTPAEEFFINGTTNLAVSNGSLLLQIGTAEFNPGGFGSSFYESNVSIRPGEHGVNTWSAEVLPSQWKVYTKPPAYYQTPAISAAEPGRYQVVVSSVNPYGPNVAATQYLFIISTGAGNTSGTYSAEETHGSAINRLDVSGTTSWYLTLLTLFSVVSSPHATQSLTPPMISAGNDTTPTVIIPAPLHPAGKDMSVTRPIPDLFVNYSEIAFIGQQDPSDLVDENRKNTIAQVAIADKRVRNLLVNGGRIEGVLFQCHPTPKDRGGAACALALRVLHEGSNWDFLVDEKSREVVFIQREVLPERI
jgi:hypothetical protein